MVIVTYHSAEDVGPCIDSVLAQSVGVEVLAVDNASTDGTVGVLGAYVERFPSVRVFASPRNVGLAAGNNVALGRVTGDYLLFLNPDTVLGGGTLAHMAGFLDSNPDFGVVGPLNRYADGTRHSTFSRDWGLARIFVWRVLPYSVPRRLCDRYSRYEFREPAFVSGACLLIRRSLFERIGGYDPEFFLAIEDVADLCLRARRAGFRVGFLPEVEVTHIGARSGRRVTFTVLWEGNRASVYYCLKHHGIPRALACTALLIGNAVARSAAAAAISVVRPGYRGKILRHLRLAGLLVARNPILRGRSALRGALAPAPRGSGPGAAKKRGLPGADE